MSSTIVFDVLARDRASDKFDKIGDSASRSSGKLKKFAAVGAAAVAGAAVVAGKAMIDMTKAAMEDEKSQAMLSKALENNAGATRKQVAAVEDWITAQGKALGIADDELRPALSKLVTATKDVGEAQKLSSLALDISTGTGKSYTSIVDALVRAQNGQVSGLSRLGVATKDAEGNTKSMADVTKDLAKTFGGQAAAAADTAQGKFGRLKLQFDETKEAIGAKLLPIAERLGDWLLNKGVPAAQKFGDWFQQKIMPPLRDFANDAAPKARQIMDALKDAFEDAKPFLELVGKVVTNVVVPGMKKLLEVAGPVLVTQIRNVGKAFEFMGNMGKAMWNNALQPAFKFMLSGISTVLDKLGDMFSTLGSIKGAPAWIGKTGDALHAAAKKVDEVSNSIRKIPNRDVQVRIHYKYIGRKNGVGGTRSDDPLDPSGYLGRGRLEMTTQQATTKFFDALADGMKKGGKKLDAVLDASRTRLKDKLGGIRDEMKSMASSVASALNQVDFSGSLQEHLASLTGTNGALAGLMAVFQNLKDGASKNYLSSLMQSGNIGLATALANDPAALAQASSLYDANAAMAQGLGDQTAQQVMGDKLEKALKDEIGKMVRELKDSPSKTARELRKEIQNLRIELTGGSAGQRAYLRGAGG